MANFNSPRHPYSCFPFPTFPTVPITFFFFNLRSNKIKRRKKKRKGKYAISKMIKEYFFRLQHLSAGDLVIVVTTIEYFILVRRSIIEKRYTGRNFLIII